MGINSGVEGMTRGTGFDPASVAAAALEVLADGGNDDFGDSYWGLYGFLAEVRSFLVGVGTIYAERDHELSDAAMKLAGECTDHIERVADVVEGLRTADFGELAESPSL